MLSHMLADDSLMRKRGIGAVLISPSGTIFEFSNRLEEERTNNQVEYEALLFGLEFLE